MTSTPNQPVHGADSALVIPPPPDHVPETFKAVWSQLPGCCRNFYLKPGVGCCAGLPAPKAAVTLITPAPAQSSKPVEPAMPPPGPMKRQDPLTQWVRHLVGGLYQDIRLLIRAQDE